MSPKGRTLFGEQDPYELSLPRSEVSSSNRSRSGTHPPKKHRPRPRPARTGSSTSTTTRSSARTRPRPRRKISYATRLRVAVESKLRLTIAFGFAIFASLIIYIALFVTKTSSGPLFHILSIVLLVCLGAIMIHSLVRFLALNSELKAHRSHRAGLKKTPSARGWNISRPLPQFTKSSTLDEKADEIGQADGGYENDDFPVFHAGGMPNHYEHHENPFDDTHDLEAQHHAQPLQHPPPVYGNTRTSIRLSINPNAPYNQNNPDPNITAPAPTLAPGMPGWHPPSFRSEGGITAVLERRRREVEERLGGGGARRERNAAAATAAGGGARDSARGGGQDGYAGAQGGEEEGMGEAREEHVRDRESGEVLLGRGRYHQPGFGGGGMI